MDGDAAGGEWNRDTAGADAELSALPVPVSCASTSTAAVGVEMGMDLVVDRSPGVAVRGGVRHAAMLPPQLRQSAGSAA